MSFRVLCGEDPTRAGHEGLGVERVVRMADVDLSMLYREMRLMLLG